MTFVGDVACGTAVCAIGSAFGMVTVEPPIINMHIIIVIYYKYVIYYIVLHTACKYKIHMYQ